MRERGLKLRLVSGMELKRRRSREGAWIEIAFGGNSAKKQAVAPVRERGLKCP